MSLADIPPEIELREGKKRNHEKRPDDVFVLVKEYICSLELRQPPMLALPAESKLTFPLTTSCDQSVLLGHYTLYKLISFSLITCCASVKKIDCVLSVPKPVCSEFQVRCL